MKSIQNRVEEIKKNGYQLDFGTVFENAFENYKKIAIYAGSMLLVFTILFIIFFTAILISVFGRETLLDFLKPENLRPENFTGNFLLIYTGCVILITCLISPFQAGFLKMADCGEKDEEFHVSTIFEYYKIPYFISIFTSSLLIAVVSSSLSLLFGFAGIQFLGTLTSILISLLTIFTIPLIIFGKMDALDAMKSSATIYLKQPFLILGLLIVAGFASLIGLIGFCIGIFFTIPFVYSLSYTLYFSIIGTEKEL
jgi:hypothetical protein